MLGYEVVLKSEEDIKELCYETEDGGLGQDSIAFDYATLLANKFYESDTKMVEVTEYEDGMYAYMIESKYGGKIYVHLDWFKKIGGYKTVKNRKELSSTMHRITSKSVINPKTGEITRTESLPLCECGEIGTTTYTDGTHICATCIDKATKVNNYNFKPSYKYIGEQIKADSETPTWYGIEVELSTNKGLLAEFMHKHKKGVYLKSDSSIRGNGYKVEMVSMPHSFKALMADDSWLSKIDMLPTNDDIGNGCHIHIGRTAFKDDKHYSLFYFLLHKMERIAVKVGGRELTSYCALAPTGKVHKKGNKREGGTSRTVFLNETNDVTVEARFFQGTTDSSRLKAYVQLLESVIKYTKYHSKTVTSKGWFGYISQKSKKYSELLDVLSDLDTSTLTASVTYREPVKAESDLTKLLACELNSVVEITLSNGNVYTDVEITSVNRSRVEFYYNNQADHRQENLTSITKLVIEKE